MPQTVPRRKLWIERKYGINIPRASFFFSGLVELFCGLLAGILLSFLFSLLLLT